MLKTIARILLLRVLPRRILPIVTVVEALLFLRGIRNRSRVKVTPPTASRQARIATRPATATPPAAATTALPTPRTTSSTTPSSRSTPT